MAPLPVALIVALPVAAPEQTGAPTMPASGTGNAAEI
jgi:hypothetical protein